MNRIPNILILFEIPEFDVLLICHVAEEMEGRPKLKLLPRSVNAPVNELADNLERAKIFGEAKPRDEKEFEKKKGDEIDGEYIL